ncbi:MAG: uracil-DNA glycosylase [Spirochaetales bacterium]|nr:uracil-DNA glycosylase [Spirochaetales bacterium]
MGIDRERKEFLDAAFSEIWNAASDFERTIDPDLPIRPAAPDFSPVTRTLAEEASTSAEVYGADLPRLEEICRRCTSCRLAGTRTNVVFGTGSTNPLVMVIGEGPGYHEDVRGLPFVGDSGQYLDKWLAAINLSRDTNVYICNIVKCRPPQNRDPMDDEISACRGYLIQQIRLLKPRAILGVGKFAAQFLCNSDRGISDLRGNFRIYSGIPVICTYHPSAVLRNPGLKRDVWEDLKKLSAFITRASS